MKGYIDGVDFLNLSPMKYWSFTAGTSDATKKEVVRNAIFSGDYLGALKVDGFYERLLKDEDGNCFMIARSRNVKGEIVDKIDWVPQLQEWMKILPNGTCLLSEAYLPGNEGSKNVTSILGCLPAKAIERQKKTPLHFHIFDCMAISGHSLLNTPYMERAYQVEKMVDYYPATEYIHYAQFYDGEDLWEKLQEYLAEGREGIVIMRKDAIVYQKRTPARVSIKVKQELKDTIDCFFTGKASAPTELYTGKEIETWEYWQSLVTGQFIRDKLFREYMNGGTIRPVTKSYFSHFAGSLEIGVYKDGAIYPIGWLSNLPEEIKANPKAYAMRPIEVTAMSIDLSNGFSLRHGKMVGWRDDINPEDCTYDKLV